MENMIIKVKTLLYEYGEVQVMFERKDFFICGNTEHLSLIDKQGPKVIPLNYFALDSNAFSCVNLYHFTIR